MALGKKRKFGAGDELDDGLAADHSPRKKPRHIKGSVTLQLIPPYYEPPTENLLMKLPAELRNKIYGLVLVDEEDDYVYIRAWKKHKGCKHLCTDGIKPEPWQEPSLLLVSKQIRNEASAMYYNSIFLTLFLTTAEFEEAYNWLKQLAARCETGFGPSISLEVTTGSWSDFPSWLFLAKMFFDIDLFGPEAGALLVRHCRFPDYVEVGGGIAAIGRSLQEVANIGHKGLKRGLSWDMVEEDFKDWAVAVLTRQKPYRKFWDLMDQLGLHR